MFQVINHLRKKLSSPLQDNNTVNFPCSWKIISPSSIQHHVKGISKGGKTLNHCICLLMHSRNDKNYRNEHHILSSPCVCFKWFLCSKNADDINRNTHGLQESGYSLSGRKAGAWHVFSLFLIFIFLISPREPRRWKGLFLQVSTFMVQTSHWFYMNLHNPTWWKKDWRNSTI